MQCVIPDAQALLPNLEKKKVKERQSQRECLPSKAKCVTSVIESFEGALSEIRIEPLGGHSPAEGPSPLLPPAVGEQGLVQWLALMTCRISFHGTTYTNTEKIKAATRYRFSADPTYQQQINRSHFQQETTSHTNE